MITTLENDSPDLCAFLQYHGYVASQLISPFLQTLTDDNRLLANNLPDVVQFFLERTAYARE